MSETIYHEKEGGSPPGGMPPSDVGGDVARAEETLDQEREADPDKSYGRVEHDFVNRAGDPGRFDQGRSTGLAPGGDETAPQPSGPNARKDAPGV